MIVTILTVLLWILAIPIGLVLVALCTPIRASGSIDGLAINEEAESPLEGAVWRFRLQWLGGLIAMAGMKTSGAPAELKLRVAGLPLPIKRDGRGGRAKKGEQSEEERNRKRERASRRRRARRRGSGVSWQEVRGLLPEVRWLLARLIRTLRLEAEGELEYGFDDPMATGLCEAVRPLLPLPEPLRLTPDFTEARLEGWARLRLSVYPIAAVAVVLRAAFRPGVRYLWWSRLKRSFVQRFSWMKIRRSDV